MATHQGERRPRNAAALLLSTVSGLGHIYLEHYLFGALLFSIFVSALNGVFLATTLQTLERPTLLLWSSVTVLGVTWLFGMVSTWRLTYGTDRAALEKEKAGLLRAALLDYLRDDLEVAIKKLERAVKLDVDWIDPDPLFHLGVACLRLAEQCARRDDQSGAKRARRRGLSAFRTCEARDLAGKWTREIAAEQKRLKRRVTGTGRMRALPSDASESHEMLPPLAALEASVASGVRPAAGVGNETSGSGVRSPADSGPVVVPPPPRGSGKFGSPRSSGSFPAARAAGAAPAARAAGAAPTARAAGAPGAPPSARSSGSFPPVRGSGRFAASSGSHAALDPVTPAEGAAPAPAGQPAETPAAGRAPGRTSRRLVAKRLKKLLQEELGPGWEEDVEAAMGSSDREPPLPLAPPASPEPPKVAVLVRDETSEPPPEPGSTEPLPADGGNIVARPEGEKTA